jgi:hypothetical protein
MQNNISANPSTQIHNKSVITRKNNELIAHIATFFDIGGVELPCELLKDLLYEYMESQKSEPDTDYKGELMIIDKANKSMELMSFFSVLYEKWTALKKASEVVQ